MNNSTYPNNPQEAIFVPVQKCPYHVTLDLEHTLDASWPGVPRVQVWWRSGHLPARSDWSARIVYIIYISYIVYIVACDRLTNWLQYFVPASGRSKNWPGVTFCDPVVVKVRINTTFWLLLLYSMCTLSVFVTANAFCHKVVFYLHIFLLCLLIVLLIKWQLVAFDADLNMCSLIYCCMMTT